MADFQQLQKQVISKYIKRQMCSEGCGICYSDDEDEDFIYLQPCKHLFCRQCLDSCPNRKCPICGLVYQGRSSPDQFIQQLIGMLNMTVQQIDSDKTIVNDRREVVKFVKNATIDQLRMYNDNISLLIELIARELSAEEKILVYGKEFLKEFVLRMAREDRQKIIAFFNEKGIRQYRHSELIEILSQANVCQFIPALLERIPADEEVTALLIRKCKKINDDSQHKIRFGEFLCLLERARTLNSKTIHLFFQHYYNRQWYHAVERIPENAGTSFDDIWKNALIRSEEKEMKVVGEGDNAFVKVKMFSTDGNHLLYDGWWHEKQFDSNGMQCIFYEQDYLSNLYYLKQLNSPFYLNEYYFADKRGDAGGRDDNSKFYLFESNVHRYEGPFQTSKKQGKGCEYDGENNTLIYEGDFSNNQYCGFGKQYYPFNGQLKYEGLFNENGQYHGEGSEYDYLGRRTYYGCYSNGKPAREGIKALGFHYGKEVRNYGELNNTEDMLYYYHIHNCNVENMSYGDPQPESYDTRNIVEEELVGQSDTCPVGLRHEKAYIYVDNEIIEQYINGIANMEEKSIIKKSKKSRIIVFYGPFVPDIEQDCLHASLSDLVTICMKDQYLEELYFNYVKLDMSLPAEYANTTMGIHILSLKHCCFDSNELVFSMPLFNRVKTLIIKDCRMETLKFCQGNLRFLQNFMIEGGLVKSVIMEDETMMELVELTLNDMHYLKNVSFGSYSVQAAKVTISNCPELTSLLFKKGCCRIVPSFCIFQCDKLEQLEFEQESFHKCLNFVLERNSSLKTLHIGKKCFSCMRSFTILSCLSLKYFNYKSTTLQPRHVEIDSKLDDNVLRKLNTWLRRTDLVEE